MGGAECCIFPEQQAALAGNKSAHREELKTHRTKTIAVAPQTELEKVHIKSVKKKNVRKKGRIEIRKKGRRIGQEDKHISKRIPPILKSWRFPFQYYRVDESKRKFL